jgi:D-glycero-alpha-D-manno-heptose-7-phosphate kinase
MIISRTPFRISFFGGGTDYPQWYLNEGGAVLSTTIDKYIYISCRYLPPFFPQRHRIVWSRIESPWTIDEIVHPAIREGLKYLGFDDATGFGLDLHYQGDLPAQSGMGSSSTFSVGLINALTALKREHLGRHELAQKAIKLEREILQETGGVQDQVAAAFGGLNHIEFTRSGEILVQPVLLKNERLAELERSLVLIYSGLSRSSSAVASDIVVNIEAKRQSLSRMHKMVNQAIEILSGTGPLADFGALMHDAWNLKRDLSSRISNDSINAIYEKAREAGSIGGKLLGAGESGFMLFFVPPPQRQQVLSALSGYLHVPFRFSRQGSSIVYHDDEFTDHDIEELGAAHNPRGPNAAIRVL